MGYKISRISLFFCSWPVSQWGVSVNTWKFEEMYLVVTRQLFEAIGWAAARWKAHSILNNCGWSDEPSRHLYAIYQPYSSRFKYTVGPANDRYEMFDVIKKKKLCAHFRQLADAPWMWYFGIWEINGAYLWKIHRIFDKTIFSPIFMTRFKFDFSKTWWL